MTKRFLAFLFLFFIAAALVQCGRRGRITGGPKDTTPPVLLKTVPENGSVNFEGNKIKLFFDEYIKLVDVQNQLIVSPPLKYLPDITPQGGPAKYVEIKIKDTLRENTTYTFNFGQSVQDNNEGNPSSFLTYVFSTGDYIDSLELLGVVKDAFKKETDEFISVMLYEIDTAYTDSTLFQKPPNYITNTLDSTVFFKLGNIKKGKYALFAMKDEAKNNLFDKNSDKIAFMKDTVTLPTDSTYLLTLFREIPNYSASVPRFEASNKIVFGYYGGEEKLKITPLSKLPDSVRTKILKVPEKDSLNFWFTPFEMDSLVFTVHNQMQKVTDTFVVKRRKVDRDSMRLSPSTSGLLNFNSRFYIENNTPINEIDTAKIKMMNQDSIPVAFKVSLDSIANKADFDFKVEAGIRYNLELFPGAITDFFGETNDTLSYSLATKSLEDYGALTVNVQGKVEYPIILQLTTETGERKLERFAQEPQSFNIRYIEPGNYLIRVIQDSNGNRKWDTGNYLKRTQPEKVSYYPGVITMRANWEEISTFTIKD
jgi:uncharacterized protein (DUF2141 family)